MIIINCIGCGKGIKTFPCRKRKFCDRECRTKYWKSYNSNGVKRSDRYENIINKCFFCKKHFHPLHGRQKSKFCSKECCYKYRIISPTKQCTGCKKILNKSEFHKRNDHKYGKWFSKCKKCMAIITLRWRKENPDRVRDIFLQNEYGLNLKKFRNMEKKQNYLCAICNNKEKLVVDHDHKSQQVRGLLCQNCNRLLGNAKDNITTLENAITYIRRKS